MQKLLRWAGYILSILLLIAAGWVLFRASSLIWVASDTVKLGIVTGGLSVAALLYNNARQQIREIKSRQFAEKRQAYQKFFDLMFDVFAAQRDGVPVAQEELIVRMNLFVKDVMIWGSAETINQYNTFIRNSLVPLPEGDPKVFNNMEDLLRSLRRDLGHDDRKLEKLGLTKLLIKGDEHYKLA